MPRIKVSGKGPFVNKPLLIGIVTGAVLLVLVIILLIRSQGPFVGQVYRPSVIVIDDADEGSVYFRYAEGFAAREDAVTIPLYVKTYSTPGKTIEGLQLCFNFDSTQFTINNIDITLDGWSIIFPASNVGDYLSTPGTGCPLGYTNGPIDIAVAPGADSITSETEVLGELQLTVNSGETFPAETIELATVKVSGLEGGIPYRDDEDKTSNTAITIVPPCPDVDRDGYATPGTVQENFVSGRDMRACRFTNPLAMPIVLDCNDNIATGGSMFPGNTETCDGFDNDCDDTDHTSGTPPVDLNAIDDDLSGSTDNDNVRGVCSGQQICLGTYPMINSYAVPDGPNPEDLDAIRRSVRDNPALTPFITFFNGATRVYSFDVYDEPTESGAETRCDQLDNDCDGSIDEGLSDCALGGMGNVGRVSAQTAGNVYIEYLGDEDDEVGDPEPDVTRRELRFPQELTPSDRLLYNLLHATRLIGCGRTGQVPCTGRLDPETEIWYCKDNVYYLIVDEVLEGTVVSLITKYDPMESSPRSIATIDEIEDCA